MNFSFESLLHAFARLAPRERLMAIGGGVAALMMVVYLVASSMHATSEKLERRISSKKKQVEKIQDLRMEYLTLRGRSGGGTVAEVPEGFSLFSFLEGVGSQTVSRERILAMSPSSRQVGDDLLERKVQMRLSGVTLESVVNLLFQVDNAEAPLFIGKLTMKKRFNDPYTFDVTLEVAHLERSA